MGKLNRFKRSNPCPVCGGGDDMARHKALRCSGYLSDDGRYAHCTRENNAGGLLPTGATPPTYAHRLDAPCKCGTTHDPARAAAAERDNPRTAPVTRRYELRDAEGKIEAVHVRLDGPGGKKCWWEAPDGRKSLGGRNPNTLPLWRLTEILAAPADRPVVVVEGEKAAEALAGAGVLTVGTVTGAAGTPADAVLRPLIGRPVTLWPDNDDKGRGHMSRIAEALVRLGARSRWIAWGRDKGDDAADFLARGGTREQLDALLDGATEPPPAAPAAALQTASRNDSDVGGVPVLVSLSTVEPKPVRWLWPGRIPLGKLTIIDGDPGLGKSTVALDLAARVSIGAAMPDGARGDIEGPAEVVVMSAEDDAADTIRPRLDAATADVSKISLLTGVLETLPAGPDGAPRGRERLLTLKDVLALQAAVETTRAKLVIVDPLVSYLATDAHVDADVRSRLMPLAKIAAETGAAVVLIRHLNKSVGGNPLYRGGGSIGIIAAVRSALLVAPSPDDERRRVLAVSKSNLAEPAPSLGFEIEAPSGVARVRWLGPENTTAAALLAAAAESQEEKSERLDAVAFLRERLSDGPKPYKDILREAKDSGISERTLDRAKAALRVVSKRQGFGRDGGWEWRLPSPLGEAGTLWPNAPETALDGGFPKGCHAEALTPFGRTPRNGPETAILPKSAKSASGGESPASPCPYPGHLHWRSIHGVLICRTCHPPASPDLEAPDGKDAASAPTIERRIV